MGNNIQIRISKVKIKSDCESECCLSFRRNKKRIKQKERSVQECSEVCPKDPEGIIQVLSSNESE